VLQQNGSAAQTVSQQAASLQKGVPLPSQQSPVFGSPQPPDFEQPGNCAQAGSSQSIRPSPSSSIPLLQI
jgi:hypothetical protein